MRFETLAWGYGLIEGPRVDGAGNLYFSDVRNGGVFRRRPDGTIDTVVPKRRGVGGIALHARGGLVISGKNICHVHEGKTRILFAPEGVPGFNDLFTDAQGRVYTGSMRSDPFSTRGERVTGECYRIEAEGRATQLYGGVSLTNGIGFSPDGKTIYHSDSARSLILVHTFDDSGKAVPGKHIPVEFPDGLAVDVEGGIWVAQYEGGAIARFEPDGRRSARVEVPAHAVTSLCFGGADGRDLYVVTADNATDPSRGGTIFQARSDVAGLPAPFARI
ncbi:MAG TPA: SMP-30/gluconolactonase/LRE family protein [Myxococcota bacterium]|nr:SMP-30/gluconolactonase/LRE family protein [Myxococcota bacterium]